MPEIMTIDKLHGDALWVITIHSGSRDGVDAWEQAVRQYMDHIASDERHLVYDTTGILNLGFTLYLQQRATALAQDNQRARGRAAIVLNVPQMVRYFFETFVSVSSRRLQPHLEVKLFNRRDEAVAWVEAGLQPISDAN